MGVCFAERARSEVAVAVRTDSQAASKFCAQNEQHTAEQVEAQRDRRRHCELRARHTCEQQPAGRHGRPQTRASARVCQQCALSRLADGTLSSLLVNLVPGQRLVPLCGHTGGPPALERFLFCYPATAASSVGLHARHQSVVICLLLSATPSQVSNALGAPELQ